MIFANTLIIRELSKIINSASWLSCKIDSMDRIWSYWGWIQFSCITEDTTCILMHHHSYAVRKIHPGEGRPCLHFCSPLESCQGSIPLNQCIPKALHSMYLCWSAPPILDFALASCRCPGWMSLLCTDFPLKRDPGTWNMQVHPKCIRSPKYSPYL